MSIHDLIGDSERSQPTIWLNKEGEHVLSLVSLTTETLPQAGQKLVAKFKVVESTGYPAGAVVSYTWDVYNNKPLWREKAVKQVKTFLCELLGTDKVGKEESEAVENGKHTGATIKAIGITKAPRPRKDNPEQMTKEFVEMYFNAYTAKNGVAEKPASILGQLNK